MSDGHSLGAAPPASPGPAARAAPRTTYQLAAAIPGAGLAAVNAALHDARRCALRWLQHQAGGASLPEAAWAGASFRCEWPGWKVECRGVPELWVWALRVEHLGRAGTTDVFLSRQARSGQADHVWVGVKLSGPAPLPDGNPAARASPSLVAALARETALADGRRLDGRPWLIASSADVRRLYDLVVSPRRALPVVVLTEPDRQRVRSAVAPYLLDADALAARGLGYAHVALLPRAQTFGWTDLVGKPWSVYCGAVRTYYPNLRFDHDPFYAHPRCLAEDIAFWRADGGALAGEAAFTEMLLARLALFSATRRLDWGGGWFVPELRTIQTALARERAADSGDLAGLVNVLEEENRALRARLDELLEEAEAYNDDAIQAASDCDYYRDENERLRRLNDDLRERLAGRAGGAPDLGLHIPASYEELPEWAGRHLAGRLVLHSRAHRGLKDARYADVERVYRALLLLANEYRAMRLGAPKAGEAFEAGLQRLELHCGGSISRERAGEQGDTYFVRFPPGSPARRFLDLHLRKGTNKDHRYCLAIYFFWDEASRQVVVGWLPSHLDNRMT